MIRSCYRPFGFVKSVITSLLIAPSLAIAQVIPDANLPSTSKVEIQGETSIITGGARAGSNLFHSFEKFSVPKNGVAFFSNDLAIENIIGRVTGSSISTIDGLIKANNAASLFLLNPNGIVLGPDASLNMGGSFLASTASSIKFADGTEFDAKLPQSNALLTPSVPVNLRFASGSGSIQVKGAGHTLTNTATPGIPITGAGRSTTGLRVSPNHTLALVGGDVILEGGVLTAPGGRIELGAVDSGLVKLSSTASNWVLGFEEAQSFRDIQFSKRALVDASGNGGGSIQLQGRNITFEGGSIGLIQNQGSSPAEAISANASNSLLLGGTSPNGKIPTGLRSQTLGTGSGADILISTQQLIQQDGGGTISTVYGAGKGGNVSIIAPKSIQLLGIVPLNPFITSNISASTYGSGNAGNIGVATGQL
ncbi:Putative hemagglutinin-related protein [uncultured Synechococcales cyanobacterium]|nr:Putative hemagglutinin-related protein [uncultured Synechococcales cyanobacterium]